MFLALASFLLNMPGVQADEALFASVLFGPKVEPVTAKVLFFRFPAMVYPYIGALKTSLYALFWHVFEPSAATVHFPALVLGALSVYVFARLLQRLQQPLWAAVLLATARNLLKIKPWTLGFVCLLAGCYPLLVYNWKTGGNSFKGNGVMGTGPASRKARALWEALGKTDLFSVHGPHALPPVGTHFDFTFPLLPWLVAAALLAGCLPLRREVSVEWSDATAPLTFQPSDLPLIPEEAITDSAGRPVFVISRLAADERK